MDNPLALGYFVSLDGKVIQLKYASVVLIDAYCITCIYRRRRMCFEVTLPTQI